MLPSHSQYKTLTVLVIMGNRSCRGCISSSNLGQSRQVISFVRRCFKNPIAPKLNAQLDKRNEAKRHGSVTCTIYESGFTGPEEVLMGIRTAKTGRAKRSEAAVESFMTGDRGARAEVRSPTVWTEFLSPALI